MYTGPPAVGAGSIRDNGGTDHVGWSRRTAFGLLHPTGKTYYIGSAVQEKFVKEVASELMHLHQAREEELAEAIVLENPGSRSAPELLATKGPYIQAVPGLADADVVVLGAETVHIASYKLYVEDDRSVAAGHVQGQQPGSKGSSARCNKPSKNTGHQGCHAHCCVAPDMN